jgi:hypothetical protein
MPLGAGHRGVKVCRLAFARLTVFLAVVAFAAFAGDQTDDEDRSYRIIYL